MGQTFAPEANTPPFELHPSNEPTKGKRRNGGRAHRHKAKPAGVLGDQWLPGPWLSDTRLLVSLDAVEVVA